MNIGYACVVSLDDSLGAQRKALRAAKCKPIFTDAQRGVKIERPGLDAALTQGNSGDVLVVVQLAVLGRSLRQLIATVNRLDAHGIGLRTLTEGLDTAAPAGNMIRQVFGALASFERDLVQERARTGMAAARAQERQGGRPRLLDAQQQAHLNTLYHTKQHTVADICRLLTISRATFYRYVASISTTAEAAIAQPDSAAELPLTDRAATTTEPALKHMEVELWLRVENNNKYIRGKTKARAEIEQWVLSQYNMRKLRADGWEYHLTIPYHTDQELDDLVIEMIREASDIADRRYCFIEDDVRALDGTDRSLPRWEYLPKL